MSEEELDRICQRLFDGDRENYVEEEFDNDGVLIYEPPPLDEVWLSKPERRDQKDALQRQRRITQRREELRSKEIKQKLKHDPVPQLAKSDVESDDESQAEQPGDDADFDSGGGDTAEEQLWRDHPDQCSDDSPRRLVQSPRPPEAPEEAPEEAPKEVPEEAKDDNGLGRGPDGRIRREQIIPNYKEGRRRASLFARMQFLQQ